MKAGSAGSIPDDGTTGQDNKPREVAANQASHALSTFLKDIGEASFFLNTVIVGLDAVERGHKKPDSLDIHWDPKDPILASRRARKFTVEAFILRAGEALIQYTKSISVLPRFRSIKQGWTSDTPSAERLDQIASAILGKDDFLIAAGILLVSWRNLVAHDGKLIFHHDKKQILRKHETTIAENYKNLNIDCLLCHIVERRPTQKDVSSLIAMAINLSRKVDKNIYDGLSKEDVQAWLDHYSITSALEKVRRETSPNRLEASIKRVFTSSAPGLYVDFTRFFGPCGDELLS